LNYPQRISSFQSDLQARADIAFFPISADLQYLTGIPRDFPTFGAIRHPGGWIEGLWLAPEANPILLLTQMTADFNNPGGNLDVRVLGEWEDPAAALAEVLGRLGIKDPKHAALGEVTPGETFIHLQQQYPGIKFVPASEYLLQQRRIKSDQEITLLKKAGEITEAAFADVIKVIKHGMTELDLILETDYQLRAHGSFGPSFTTTLYCVGPAHELFFNQLDQTLHRPLNPPVSILFDFGAIVEGYCYDFGRTVCFGPPDDTQITAHKWVMASQAVGITGMRAGQVTAEEVDAAAREVIEQAGLGEGFRHRLGHAIGLDVHEPPFLTKTDQTLLQSGMTLTVEPSIIFPFTSSARVEDIVLVTEQGGVPLTTGYQDLIVVD
jgi:Xaa-Pro aminopeptidase